MTLVSEKPESYYEPYDYLAQEQPRGCETQFTDKDSVQFCELRFVGTGNAALTMTMTT